MLWAMTKTVRAITGATLAALLLTGCSTAVKEFFGVEEAESAGADLIAMASHHRNALGRLMRGSLARRLERETTIPLLLVRYGERAAA